MRRCCIAYVIGCRYLAVQVRARGARTGPSEQRGRESILLIEPIRSSLRQIGIREDVAASWARSLSPLVLEFAISGMLARMIKGVTARFHHIPGCQVGPRDELGMKSVPRPAVVAVDSEKVSAKFFGFLQRDQVIQLVDEARIEGRCHEA